MEGSKNWYESRTVWVGIVTVMFSLLKSFNILPEGLSEEAVVSLFMALSGVLTVVFRVKATAPVGPSE